MPTAERANNKKIFNPTLMMLQQKMNMKWQQWICWMAKNGSCQKKENTVATCRKKREKKFWCIGTLDWSLWLFNMFVLCNGICLLFNTTFIQRISLLCLFWFVVSLCFDIIIRETRRMNTEDRDEDETIITATYMYCKTCSMNNEEHWNGKKQRKKRWCVIKVYIFCAHSDELLSYFIVGFCYGLQLNEAWKMSLLIEKY